MLVDGRARKGALVEVVALVVGDNHEAVLARKSGHGEGNDHGQRGHHQERSRFRHLHH
jgi:hypothetical protein